MSPIRRTAAAIAGVLATLFALALFAPQSVVTAGPAPVAPPAAAVVGQALVANHYGSPVLIRCDYSSTTSASPYSARLYEGHNDSLRACPLDVDQFRSEGDVRCIRYTGPGYTDGYYKLAANTWRKVSDLAVVDVFDLGYGSPDKCSGRPYFNHT